MLSFFLRLSRAKLLFVAAMMILIVALIDWRVELNVSFGFLYLFPMLIVGSCLLGWQLAILGGLCTFLAELFSPFWNTWDLAAGVPRDIFMFAAYFGTALFAHESAKNRRLTAQHVREVEQEALLRRDAEQQLKALIESSPAAILTVDSAGRILMANQAAHRLLGFEPETLPGESIKDFLPPLARVRPADESTPSFRTAMQCSGRRRDGDVFLADIWFSTYKTSAGPRLAAMLVDSSEDLRDKEESSLHHLLVASRLAVGAVSHEIRNVCAAISVVYENLSRGPELAQSEDFRALGDLVEGLGRIATLELGQSAGSEELAPVDLGSVLDELRIVTELPLRESGVLVRWDVPKVLPRVWAERHNLLQVLLNLTKNSQRAMEDQERKELTVSVSLESERVVVRVRDTGHGVPNPERLFQPFQQGAEATGLGLYLSRAFARTFKGDLRYEPGPAGCCFALDLAPFADQGDEEGVPETNG
ncbi:MAG: ATP-binding protein [Terriglobia bacterium]|jgi:PAS domain S-box-containing protein